mgnify:FL=1
MSSMTKRNVAAGVWEIIDTDTNERVYKFRARKRADVDKAMNMVRIGLKKQNIEARFITEWEEIPTDN